MNASKLIESYGSALADKIINGDMTVDYYGSDSSKKLIRMAQSVLDVDGPPTQDEFDKFDAVASAVSVALDQERMLRDGPNMDSRNFITQSELMAYAPITAESLIESICEDFYNLDDDHSIEAVLGALTKGDKPVLTHDTYYSADELWPYREFDRSPEDGRHDQESWDKMKSWLETDGWDPRSPLGLTVSQDGEALVTDGNHRLAIAKELGLEKIPVKFSIVHSLSAVNRE